MLSLKQLLEEITEQVLAEKLLGRFDIRAFRALEGTFQDNIEFVRKAGLKQIGEGTGRVAFYLSTGKILKISKEPEQSRGEVYAFKKFGPDLVPRIFEYDPQYDWIIAEPARTFDTWQRMEDETNVSLNLFSSFSSFVRNGKIRKFDKDTIEEYNLWAQEREEKNPFGYKTAPRISRIVPAALGKRGHELLRKLTTLVAGGVYDITRPDHWGVAADRRLVVVDTGLIEVESR